ncbi:anhydro-N-acetylmuramic acid kinase [Lutibacter oricola]|uniref:Anhydro-N-acetylmuramic acid kinase n=1 Tax=Lutibacter oricola TaxID=762486 RepID=A0A1H3GIZ5_9FLAO|nr:anhydro-N-acetylmuramic acid kinase [Lutibacter oricola]SDY03276.1 anhydro-N-acetylmuramic acid kinase [Lutibacter oricola]
MSKIWKVIGLMSGTSLDGVDLVYTKISKTGEKYTYEIINSETIRYPKLWEDTLRNGFYKSIEELNLLDIKYGSYLGELINKFISKNNIAEVDFIASHGHTIFHKPDEGYTLQIGDGQSICNTTKLKVVCDFRTQDVELGGQGAPLVPIGDRLLFSAYDYCLNLGGFANISFEKNKERIAFDICPANIVLNHYVKKLGFNYDDKGEISEKGIVNENLLKDLNEMKFYSLPVPKSLGFEFVTEKVFPIIDAYKLEIKDILRTFVEHIAVQINLVLKKSEAKKVLVTGGGAFNIFLMLRLKTLTKSTVIIPNKALIDYKEALVFAFLGVLRVENQVNCLSSVTGAAKNHSSGKILTFKH